MPWVNITVAAATVTVMIVLSLGGGSPVCLPVSLGDHVVDIIIILLS